MMVAFLLHAGPDGRVVRIGAALGLHEDGVGAESRGIPCPEFEHPPDAGSLLLHSESTPVLRKNPVRPTLVPPIPLI
jgi:hypothetical protein